VILLRKKTLSEKDRSLKSVFFKLLSFSDKVSRDSKELTPLSHLFQTIEILRVLYLHSKACVKACKSTFSLSS